jgi:uncharacterized damage-inducible protein DinB
MLPGALPPAIEFIPFGEKRNMLQDFKDEFERYKVVARKAIDQMPDDAINLVVGSGNNSVAMLIRHISGNLVSRFTDFLSSDGEKPWRNRDAEFADVTYDREEVDSMWARGWEVLENELATLTDADLQKRVYIRGQAFTVHEALARSVAHVSYHVGQIVLLARILTTGEWQWITIPKGKSQDYNQNPIYEKGPK